MLTEAGFDEIHVYARGGALAVAAYKTLGFVLLLLANGAERPIAGLLSRLAGVFLLPVAAIAALVGNLGLWIPGQCDDTLGYTVLAHKNAFYA